MKLADLPYHQFEMLGVKKSDIIHLPPRTLSALLNGYRTSLMRFNNVVLPGTDTPVSLDAKLSVDIKPDGKPTLKIHPINKTARNTFGLTADEIAFISQSPTNFVEKKIKTVGHSKEAMVYLDKITNEYVAINKTGINAPESINNVPLTPEQKEQFKSGKSITINGDSFGINPNSEIGISSIDGDDTKISRVQFINSIYSKKELALDLVYLASDHENIVLLEHLASIALFTAADRIRQGNTLPNLSNPKYWEAINDASKEIRQLTGDKKYEPAVIAEIVNKYLEGIGIIQAAKNDNKQEVKI